MGNAIAEGVAEKASEKGKAPADVAEETKLSAVSAGGMKNWLREWLAIMPLKR